MHDHLSFFDIFEGNAHLHPDKPALYWKEETINYAELFSRTQELTGGLSHLPPGSRIGILSHNHPAFFHLIGAAAALNLTLVLINRRLGAEELAHIIEDTQPTLLVHDREMADPAQTLVQNHHCLEAALALDHPHAGLAPFYKSHVQASPRKVQAKDPFIII
ncbi:MAG: AMP-binding protein, partial [Desulfovibrionales bacterium]|nr:AMP-binding protein [Desulfovibrionales bacterium]